MRGVAALLCAAIGLLVAEPVAPAEPVLAIVVHPERAVTLTAEEVATIFLRKRRFWEDGTPIVPLNREPGSAARELFSRHVLGADSSELQAYWNEQYFHGVFPPTVLLSSAAVKRYVAADRNAIGYLEWRELDDSVRVALTLE